MILTNNNLERLEKFQLSELANFIVSENFSHHSGEVSQEEFDNDVQSIHREEIKYFDYSEIYVAKDLMGSMIGAIRVLKWNYIDLLPLQKLFGINPINAMKNANHIFHIGRFAIKKEVRDISLLKKLMVHAITPVCQHEGNVAFAECDSKLLRILTLMGIKATVLGESIDYLGSETIPISMSYDGLINFYNKNKHLIAEEAVKQAEAVQTHKSVVLSPTQYNYSFV